MSKMKLLGLILLAQAIFNAAYRYDGNFSGDRKMINIAILADVAISAMIGLYCLTKTPKKTDKQNSKQGT
jgi:hypothetical protein